MVHSKRFKYFFYVVLFISLLVGLNVVGRRFQFEAEQTSVQAVVSLREIKKAALYGGQPIEMFLEELKEKTDISRVVIEEKTLADFIDSGSITLLKGSEIMNMLRVGNINRTVLNRLYKQIKIKPDYFYLLVDRKKDFERIQDFLEAEFGRKHVKQIKSYNILEVLDERMDLLTLGLGISEDDISLVKKYGFRPIYRLRNSHRVTPALIKLKIRSFVDTFAENIVIFEGESVLGFPSELPLLIDRFKDKRILIGQIEFSNQLGMTALMTALPDNIIRVHSIGLDNMQTMTSTKARQRYVRAAKERNMSLLFLHPYLKAPGVLGVVNYNLSFFKQITDHLRATGFQLDTFRQFPQKIYKPATSFERNVLFFAVLTTILFFCSFFMKLTFWRIFLFYFLSFFILAVLFIFNKTFIVSKVMALCLAIFFPVLAIISQFPKTFVQQSVLSRWISGCLYLTKVLGICLVGSIFIVGLLSDVYYLKGIERFWGIKLSFIVPLILIGLFFYLRPERIKATFFVLKRLYYAPVRTAGLLSVFFILLFVCLMIIRSGNFFVLPISFLEEYFRSFLEDSFFVRPRTKEFLIGYPFLLLAYIYVDGKISRMWIWFFNILGSIALISVVNSFCHLHTPLSISLYRSVLGLVLGIGVTIVYMFFIQILMRLFRKRFG